MNREWNDLSSEEKRRALYERQKAMLATFLEHGAITKGQHDKSLHYMTEKIISMKPSRFSMIRPVMPSSA